MIDAKFFENNLYGKILYTGDFKQAIEDMISFEDWDEEDEKKIISEITEKTERICAFNKGHIILTSCRTEEVEMTLIAGVAKNIISSEQNKIKMIFLILYPKSANEDYLSLLAYLNRLIYSRSFKAGLESAEDDDEIEKVIKKGFHEIEN